MGKGSSSPAPQQVTSTTTSSNLPEYARPYFERLMNRSEAASMEDYLPYQGQRVAQLNADQNAAIGGVRDIFSAGTSPYMTAAQDASLAASGYTPKQWTDPGVSQSYMNPYLENVLNLQVGREQQRFAEAQAQRQAAAVKAGAFGGSRDGVVNAMALRDMNSRIQDIETNALNTAYNTGANIFGTDRNAMLAGQQLNVGAAGQLGQLANADQTMALQRASSLGGAGTQQQQLTQSGLDMAYADFTNQRDYDRQQLNFLSGILRGVPVSASSEVTQATPAPNPYNSALGLGIAGLGALGQAGYKPFA